MFRCRGCSFMNSDLIQREADALLARLGPEDGSEAGSTTRIQRAYRILFQREPGPAEVQRGLEFLKRANTLFENAQADAQSDQAPPRGQENQRRPRARAANQDPEAAAVPLLPAGRMTPWQQYAQALLSAGEFYYVN